MWQPSDLIFTNEVGDHITKSSLYRAFKKTAASIGRPDARFSRFAAQLRRGRHPLPEMTSKRFKATWDMPPQPLRWTSTAM